MGIECAAVRRPSLVTVRIRDGGRRGKACGYVDESYGPARALRDVWTKPGQHPCCPPFAHTLGPLAHIPTGSKKSSMFLYQERKSGGSSAKALNCPPNWGRPSP
jgi:hypothetical protein